jgi:hypothetical protein
VAGASDDSPAAIHAGDQRRIAAKARAEGVDAIMSLDAPRAATLTARRESPARAARIRASARLADLALRDTVDAK